MFCSDEFLCEDTFVGIELGYSVKTLVSIILLVTSGVYLWWYRLAGHGQPKSLLPWIPWYLAPNLAKLGQNDGASSVTKESLTCESSQTLLYS